MRRILFQVCGVPVHAYPALLYVGMVCGLLVGTALAGRHGLNPARTYFALLLLTIPSLVGSRLLFVLTHWRHFRDQPRRIWRRSEGGASLYGGLLLTLVLSVPLLAALGLPFGGFWDVASVTILTGMIFTKFGCLLNGCCSGRPTQSVFGLNLPNHDGECCRRVPAQLLEAGAAAVLLGGSLAAWDRLPFPGAVILGNLAGYGLARWGLEFIRESRGMTGPARVNRTISAALLAGSVGAFLLLWWRRFPPP